MRFLLRVGCLRYRAHSIRTVASQHGAEDHGLISSWLRWSRALVLTAVSYSTMQTALLPDHHNHNSIPFILQYKSFNPLPTFHCLDNVHTLSSKLLWEMTNLFPLIYQCSFWRYTERYQSTKELHTFGYVDGLSE